MEQTSPERVPHIFKRTDRFSPAQSLFPASWADALWHSLSPFSHLLAQSGSVWFPPPPLFRTHSPRAQGFTDLRSPCKPSPFALPLAVWNWDNPFLPTSATVFIWFSLFPLLHGLCFHFHCPNLAHCSSLISSPLALLCLCSPVSMFPAPVL